MNLYQVIKYPLVTEKSTSLQLRNKYIFAVDKKATKNDIKKFAEKLFRVKVIDVKTFNIQGKRVRIPKLRKTSKRKNWKKAIITVKAGQKIEDLNLSFKEEKVASKER